MLSIVRSCTRPDGTASRREVLRVGGLGAAGLSLAGLLQAREEGTGAPPFGTTSFGKARACIVFFLDGGAPHQDTFDLKPEAPAGIRGEFKPIATNVPGIKISEHFPRIARHADKLALVRSVHVGSDVHEVGTYAMLSGAVFKGRVVPDATRETPEDHPSIGSVISYLRGRGLDLPGYVWLPFIWKGFPVIAQGYAGFLGRAHDPFRILRDPNAPSFSVEALSLPADVPLERLAVRRRLWESLDRQAERLPAADRLEEHRRKAVGLISSPRARKAFDLAAEAPRVRDRYGRHTVGQSLLLARRLVEHGVPLVTVYWNDYRSPQANLNNWDTHSKNYHHLKSNLMPATDLAFTALLEDLAERGMLDETLVVLTGDFGRTPKINPAGGRDHWGGCCSVLFAGAGIRGGQVFGSSDKIAAYPKDNPVRPGNLVATMYHCLGVRTDLELPDPFGRPIRLCADGPVRALLA